MAKSCRPYGRFFCWILTGIFLGAMATPGHGARTTRVNDIVYRADGTPAKGTLVISWPAFTTSQGEPVAAGRMSVSIGANGLVDLALVPNTGSTPASYYSVVLKLDDGTSATEYWTVPVSTSATVAAVRSKVVPANVAVQSVGRDYVDSADAATKAYVDAAVQAASGNVVLNPTGTQVVNQPTGTSLQVNRADLGNVNGVRYADRFAKIQTAVDDAGTTGAVLIPPGHGEIDTFTNANGRPILDLRKLGDLRGGAISVKDFGATGNSGYYPSVGMSSGSTTVVINAVWKVGNMAAGTPITIKGAGPSGADLVTTIVSVSGGNITVAAAASTTVSNVGVWWGNDDTAAIQAAINYAHTLGGGTIVFPFTGGDYIVSNLTVPALTGVQNGGITLQGAGRRQATKIVGIGADQTAIITVAAGAHPTKITGLSFDSFNYSNTVTPQHQIAIDVLGGIEHHITDNYFANVYHAIRMTSTFLNTIDFNRFYGSYDSCIKFVPGASAVIDTTIDRNEFGVCGSSQSHGWALEQLSTGGGGSNWLRITNNDCEGTEWNGCWYLKNVSDFLLANNRTEVDAHIGDGSWVVLYNDGSAGMAINNDLNGNNYLKGGGVVFYNNSFFINGSGCALTIDAAGAGATIVGNGFSSNMIRSQICGNTSGVVLSNHIDGIYSSGNVNIFGGLEPSNIRKMAFMTLYGPNGGSVQGWGNATPIPTAQRLPNAVAGSVFSHGDRLYNSYYPTINGSLSNLGWMCATPGDAGTCSYDGTNWTGTIKFLNGVSQCLVKDGTAAPTSGGPYNPCDFVNNTNWNGTSSVPYGWYNILSGSPGTWKAIYIVDPAVPPAIGSTTPNTGTFSTLNSTGVSTFNSLVVTNNASVGGTASVSGDLNVTGRVTGASGQFTSGQKAPNQISGLLAWYKADNGTDCTLDGASVTTWTDSSGNANSLAGGAVKPICKLNIVNNKPVLRWNGSTTNGMISGAALSSSAPFTIMVVYSKPVSSSSTAILDTDTSIQARLYWDSATLLRVQTSGSSPDTSAVTDDGAFHVVQATFANGTSTAFFDGTSKLSAATTSGSLSQKLVVGSLNGQINSKFNGDIAEIAVFSGQLSANDRGALDTYVNNKYGLTVSDLQNPLVAKDQSSNVMAQVDVNGRFTSKGAAPGFTTVSFSTTPVFDASVTNTFKITLTGNVASSTLSNAAAGQPLTFILCQDTTGSRTMTWPANMTGAMTVGSTANKCSAQSFVFDGANAVATSPGVTNQ